MLIAPPSKSEVANRGSARGPNPLMNLVLFKFKKNVHFKPKFKNQEVFT